MSIRTFPSSEIVGPDAFSLTSQTGVTPSSVITSNTITLNGPAGETWPLCVEGDGSPQLQINSGPWVTGGIAVDGDTVKVRLTTNVAASTENVATLYAPGRSNEFSVTTSNIWLPSVISPSMWLRGLTLDAISDGVGIGTWADISGNGRDVTEATNKPTKQTAAVGSVARFDGSNDKLTGPAISNLITGAAYTAFITFKASSIASNDATVYANDSLWTDAGAAYFGLSLKSGTPSAVAYNYDGSYDAVAGVTIDTTNFFILSIRHESGVLYMSVNGGTEISVASGNTGALTYLFQLGQSYNGALRFTGDMREIVFFNSALSTGDMEKMQGYLAWDAGLEANLPGGHPYAGSPP